MLSEHKCSHCISTMPRLIHTWQSFFRRWRLPFHSKISNVVDLSPCKSLSCNWNRRINCPSAIKIWSSLLVGIRLPILAFSWFCCLLCPSLYLFFSVSPSRSHFNKILVFQIKVRMLNILLMKNVVNETSQNFVHFKSKYLLWDWWSIKLVVVVITFTTPQEH